MKKELHSQKINWFALFMLLVFYQGVSQPITVSTTTYTVEQLVKNVLIKTPCAQISNVTWSTGSSFPTGDQSNGIGYFQNTNSTFDIARKAIDSGAKNG